MRCYNYIYHYRDTSDYQEQIKTLGYFSTKEKALQAFKKYKFMPGFKEHPPNLGTVVIGGETGWEEGFISELEGFRLMAEKAGEPWPPPEGISEETLEDEDLILDIPYWAKDAQLKPSESSETFAHRLMEEEGIEDYPTAPKSEFYQLKIWADNIKKWEVPVKEFCESTTQKKRKKQQDKKDSLPKNLPTPLLYAVTHFNPKNNEIKGIGRYLTPEEAEKAIATHRTAKGFRDVPDTFFIQPYRINETHWESGFATVIIPRNSRKKAPAKPIKN